MAKKSKKKVVRREYSKPMSESFGLFQSENTCREDCKVDQENRGRFTSEGA